MKPTQTFDAKCYDLAELFLEDEQHLATQDNCEELAGILQTTIENFIYYKNADLVEAEAYAAGQAADHKREQRDEDRRLFYSKAGGVWIRLED